MNASSRSSTPTAIPPYTYCFMKVLAPPSSTRAWSRPPACGCRHSTPAAALTIRRRRPACARCDNIAIRYAHRTGPAQSHQRRHRRQRRGRSSRRSRRPRGRGAEIVVAPEMALPGYCIGDLVEDGGFLEANERAMQRIAAGGARHHRGRRLHRLRPAAAQRHRHDPQVQRRGGRPRRPGPAARAQVAAPQLPLLRRQALLHAGRGARAGRRRRCRRAATRIGVSICEDMWDDFYDVKPLPELAAQGRGACSSTSTRRRSIPASATSATR